MRALLLAAGLGTRLKPVTDHIPKCLVPIEGRPLLEYWLELLCKAGVGPILVNLHHLSERVQGFLEQSRYRGSVTTVREERLLGTAGTLLKNRDFFAGEPIMLVHADNLSRFDVAAFIRRHQGRPAGCQITMMTFRSDAPSSCGIVELDSRGVVVAFHEKVANPPGDLANAAVYIVEPTLFPFLERLGKSEIDFSLDVLPKHLGAIFTFLNDDYHRDIGTPESYQAALAEFPAKNCRVAGLKTAI